MNETSATSASGASLLPDGIATLTAIHFTIIAVVAILVVIGLIWGIRTKRSRVKASREVIANAEEAGIAPEPVAKDHPSDRAAVEQRTAVEPGAAAARPTASQAQTQTQAVAPAPAPSSAPPAAVPDTSPAVALPVDSDAGASKAPDRLVDEPIVTAPSKASPAAEAAAPVQQPSVVPGVAPSTTYANDPVTQLKGLGPKVATRLGEFGVTTIGDMAALSDGEAQSIDAQLGAFTGRMGRDRWIEQARLLAAGDKTGFEALFGKL